MRYVLDASVAVAAVRPAEPAHAPSARRLAALFDEKDTVVVPAIFIAEVAAALARTGTRPEQVDAYVARLLASPLTLVTVGPRAAERIARTATRFRLRAADAAYLWVARSETIPFVTVDDDVHKRAGTTGLVERP